MLNIPIGVYASNGKLKANSIIECNGIEYGYHGCDNHYHKAILKNGEWYAEGEIITEVCNDSTEIVEIENEKDNISTIIVDKNINNFNSSTDYIDRDIVTLLKCVDGDTTHFNLNGTDITVRYLAINAPESTTKKEFYGEESSKYVCNKLKNATKIELEYDGESNKLDKYNRTLAWVIVDGENLQIDLVKNGYAEVKYIYGNYKYLEELKSLEIEAKKQKLGIWQDYKEDYSKKIYIAISFLIIIILLFSKNKRSAKKIFNKVKKKI